MTTLKKTLKDLPYMALGALLIGLLLIGKIIARMIERLPLPFRNWCDRHRGTLLAIGWCIMAAVVAYKLTNGLMSWAADLGCLTDDEALCNAALSWRLAVN